MHSILLTTRVCALCRVQGLALVKVAAGHARVKLVPMPAEHNVECVFRVTPAGMSPHNPGLLQMSLHIK